MQPLLEVTAWDVLKFLASAAEYGLALACGTAVGILR